MTDLVKIFTEGETPETDALCGHLQGDPAVSFSESDAEELATHARSCERRARALEEALRVLCDKCDLVGQETRGVFATMWARGQPYDGPNYGEEVKSARNLLAAIDKRRKPL